MQYLKIANELLSWNFRLSSFEAEVYCEWITFTKATAVY